MAVKNFETAVQMLTPRLLDYLKEKGIEPIRNKILCINPEHKDSNPSMSLYPNHSFYCHGCGCSGDIFKAVHYLENKPKEGPGWLQQVFLYLAEKFEIPVEFTELSEDELWKFQVYRAFSDIATLIAISPYGSVVLEELSLRGWTPEFCQKHHIGSIVSRETFLKTITDMYPVDFLREIDILDNKTSELRPIFSPTNLIFVVKDEFHRPIGFAARDLLWTPESTTPKYINSKSTGLRLNLYEKDKILYGLDHYLSTRKDDDEPLYILEGYPDWAACVSRGIHNVCAIGGTSFGDNHLRLLLRHNIRNIIFALDGDSAGQDKTRKLLDEKLADVKGFNFSVVILPEDLDPDDLIRQRGIQSFLELEKHDAFHWRLMQFEDRTEGVEVCKKLVPFIVSEPSFLKQEMMAKDLHRFTGISLKAINKEVDRLTSMRDRDLEARRQAISNDIARQLTKDPESAESVMMMGLQDLKNLTDDTPENIFSPEGYLSDLSIQKFQEEQVMKQLGFNLGDLSPFGQTLTGDWTKDVLLVVPGKSNHGKTSFLAQLALEIAEHNDNTIVLFLTIDDTGPQLSNRFITQLACKYAVGTPVTITMNKMRNPTYYIDNVNFNQENALLKDIRDKSYAHLQSLVKASRLIVKDQHAGRTLAFAEGLIRYYRDKCPDHKIVFFLDNFHKLEDYRSEKDERIRYKRMVNTLKNNIAVKYHIPVICTMEYTKLPAKTRPSNGSISESVSLEYDSNGIFHAYNELADYQQCGEEEQCPTWWPRGEIKAPVFEIIFGKNKVSDFKGTLFFKFFPEQSRFTYVRRELVDEWRADIREKRPPMPDSEPKAEKLSTGYYSYKPQGKKQDAEENNSN